MRHTNGDTTTNGATPRPSQKTVPVDIESTSNDRLVYKTPVALQKRKKMAPPVESSNSEGEESQAASEVDLILEKKRKRSDSTTLVRKLIDC